MNQIIVQVPLSGLVIALIVIAAVIVCLVYLVKKNSQIQLIKTEAGLKPFSEPRPYSEPTPPLRAPASPVVPVRNPNIKPIIYAYDQRYFEWFYAKFNGRIVENHVRVGEPVEKGDVLMTVSIGNVETYIRASASGKLREVLGEAGTEFKKSDLLYVIVIK